MTPAEAIRNFRMALLAVIPYVEKAQIPWRGPHNYDEWDVICTSMYGSLVIEVLRWPLPEASQAGFAMPAYDLLLEDYRGLHVLEVHSDTLGPGRHIFHSLGTVSEVLDVVETRRLSEGAVPLEGALTNCPFETARFELRLVSQ